MALVNPAGLYHQDIYRMDFQPYVNTILKARQQKAAREDAMDKYYRELPSKANDAGVRNDDRPVIEQLRNDMYSYGVQNKEGLRKGDGATQLGMEKRFRKLSDAINTSKKLGERGLQRGKLYFNKETNWVNNDEEFMAAEHEESQPIKMGKDGELIYPKEMDLVKLLSNKPIVINDEAKNLQTKFKYGSVEGSRKLDPSDPNYNIVTFVPQLDKETKDQLYNYSAQDVHNRPRLKKLIDSKVNNPIELSKLNDVSLKVFGHPIREDFKIEDGAAAFNASILPVNEPTREKVQVDVGAARKNAKDMQEDRQKYGFAIEEKRNNNIKARQKNGSLYLIDDVPGLVRNNSYTEPSINGDYQVSDATKLSEGQMEDIFGKKGGKFMERPYKPIKVNGKQLIKILPDGFEVEDADGNPVIIKDKDVLVNTNKRTVSLEKPIGTGKAEIRNDTPIKTTKNGLPVFKQ